MSARGSYAVTSESAIQAHDLAYAYGDRQALDGVGFEVGPGEIFGFLGPNGSGKSTLFQLLATLRAPQRGHLSVLGLDPVRDASAVRRRLGVVFQSPALDRELTVRENLLHHGHLYGLRGRALAGRIDAALDRFGLGDRAGDTAKTLSGGLARRVEIAKALLPEPEVLLLDEPSTGLDPGARRDLGAVLRELADSGVTVLLTTHFMEEGDRCDRLALMARGRIVGEGEPETLKRRLGGEVVVLRTEDPEALATELARRFPEIEPRVYRPHTQPETRNGVSEDSSDMGPPAGPGEVRFEREDAAAFVPRLAETFSGHRIDALTVARPTLEDVFLQLTGERLSEDEP
jgi:ABC-2 type transport system ATP-binding protein